MRLIGSLPSESEADRFSAWLLTRSIDCQVDRSDDENGFEVWVKDEDQFTEAKNELVAFRENPSGEEYRSALAEAKKIQQQRIRKKKQHQKNVHTGPTQRGLFESGPLTMVMVLICVLVAVMTEFGDDKNDTRFVARALQFVSIDSPNDELEAMSFNDRDNLDLRLASIYRGELWRTVSPIFYHYGTFHVIFNLYWLVYLGRMIEMRYGTLCLAMIVVFTAIFSNVLQSVVPVDVGGSAPWVIKNLLVSKFGGMSGVIYGLFGFIWLRMLHDPNSRLQLPQLTVFLMIAYLFYCMLQPEIGGIEGSGRVANWAHGGGFVLGMLLGLSPIGKRFGKRN